jgi:hypothetical protein
MKNRKLMATLLAVVVALVVAAPAAASALYRYPPVVRSSFISSCTQNAPYSGCRCLSNYIAARTSYHSFLIMARRYENGGPLPAVEVRGIHACGLRVL